MIQFDKIEIKCYQLNFYDNNNNNNKKNGGKKENKIT